MPRRGRADVRATVIAIIAEQALVDPAAIGDEATLADLGLGSIGVVECLFAIEEALDVAVPWDAVGGASADPSSVGAMIAAIEGLAGADR